MTVRRATIAVLRNLNTVPFVYGIEHAKSLHAQMLLSSPAECARAFNSGDVDAALLPVGYLTNIKDADMFSSYCLGSSERIVSSIIASTVPTDRIQRILFTADSVTESYYTKILAVKKWDRGLSFVQVDALPAVEELKDGDACIFTGDDAEVRCRQQTYRYCYDLAEEWFKATSRPMVYAVWVAHKSVDNSVLDALEDAFTYGMEHVWEAVAALPDMDGGAAYDYLTRQIDYIFDNQKNKALRKFWDSGLKTTLRINPG